MIIFEGPDNSGKSTAALRAAELLKGIYIKHHRKYPNAEQARNYAYGAELLGAVYGPSPVILDRFPPISEFIYGRVIRGHSRVVSRRELVSFIGPHTLVITRTAAVRMLDFGNRPQMPGVVEHASQIIEEYDDLLRYLINRGYGTVYQYDYTLESVEDLLMRAG